MIKFLYVLVIFILFVFGGHFQLATSKQRPNQEASSGTSVFIHQTPNNKQQAATNSSQSNTTRIVVVQLPATSAQPLNKPISGLASVRSRWRQMERSINDELRLMSSSLRKTLFGELLVERANHSSGARTLPVSGTCRLALAELLGALDESRLWAVQMLDSSAHSPLPSGLLEGTLTELGNFDECLSIGSGRSTAPIVVGQYCTLLIKPALIQRPRLHTACRLLPDFSTGQQPTNNNATTEENFIKRIAQNSQQFFYAGLRLGVCTPHACTRADIQLLLAAYLAKFDLLGQVKSCQTRQQSVWISERRRLDFGGPDSSEQDSQWDLFATMLGLRLDLTQQCIMLVFVLLILLCISGTLMDKTKQSDAFASIERSTCARCSARARWQRRYMLAGTSEATSTTDEAHLCALSCLPSPTHCLGLQHNPLANFSVASTSEYETFNTSLNNYQNGTTTAPIDDGKESDGVHGDSAKGQMSAPGEHRSTALIARLIVCFSLKKNLRSITSMGNGGATSAPPLSARNNSNMDDIKVIHGLRTLTMIWIIFGHTIGLVSPEMMDNLFALAHLSCSSRLLQALLNATLAVDTFFMISGLVTVISFARKCKSALDLLPVSKISAQDSATNCAPDIDLFVARSSASGSDSVILDSESLSSAGATSNDGIKCDNTAVIKQAAEKCSSTASSRSDKTNESLLDGTMKKQATTKAWPQDFQPLIWMLMRYLRLTPSYAALIGLSILLPSLGAPGGPFWAETMGQLEPACRQNWWSNLLYVNNFYATDKLCLIHSWYLSNDWQFFLIALILFGIMYKSRKLCALLVVSIFLASSAASFALIVANEFPPTIVTTSPAVAERWHFIYSFYYKPWPHLPSYIVGLFAGYLILVHQARRKQMQQSHPNEHRQWLPMSNGWRMISWLLFGSIAFALLNSIYPWNMGIQVEPHITGLHGATFRTLWAACNAWLVFALVTARNHNSLGRLLAWRGFAPTSRLTYCAYLVHPLIIYYHFGSLRERIDSSLYGQTFRFLGTLVLSYICALVLSLLVESPSIQLQRLLSKAKKTTPRSGPMTTHNSSTTIADEYSVWAKHHMPAPPPTSSGTTTASSSSSAPLYSKRAGGAQSKSVSKDDTKQKRAKRCCSRNKEHQLATGTTLFEAPSESSQTSSASAIDQEFQRKLAQAIGRGFKIRSKMVAANGATSKQRPNINADTHQRFHAPAKRYSASSKHLPLAVVARNEFVPMCQNTVNNCHGQHEASELLPPPPPPPPAPLRATANLARRGETLSTFLNQQHGQRKFSQILNKSNND